MAHELVVKRIITTSQRIALWKRHPQLDPLQPLREKNRFSISSTNRADAAVLVHPRIDASCGVVRAQHADGTVAPSSAIACPSCASAAGEIESVSMSQKPKYFMSRLKRKRAHEVKEREGKPPERKMGGGRARVVEHDPAPAAAK